MSVEIARYTSTISSGKNTTGWLPITTQGYQNCYAEKVSWDAGTAIDIVYNGDYSASSG